MHFIIQGIFFDPGPLSSSRKDSHSFFGEFQTKKTKVKSGHGSMNDDLGHSYISDIFISSSRFKFTKRYENEIETMSFSFVKNGTMWTGEWTVSNPASVNKGYCNCYVVKTRKGFSDRKITEEFFKKTAES